jgi:hypothetical protein
MDDAHLEPLVQGQDVEVEEPAHPEHAEPVPVDVRAGLQVVEGARAHAPLAQLLDDVVVRQRLPDHGPPG